MKTFVVITLLAALAVAGPPRTRPTQPPPSARVLATPEPRVCTRICAAEAPTTCGEGWVCCFNPDVRAAVC
jgi:hypothetical protein